MKHRYSFLIAATAVTCLAMVIASCEKDYVAPAPVVTPAPAQASFVEQFDNVGNLTAKGWVFRNNSNPVGQSGWRQGRYEAAGAKFPMPMVGFPAYNATTSPNDFISCDASAVGFLGNISAWLISPVVPMKNGDQIVFYTRSVNDDNYAIYIKDRMQVRANFLNSDSSVGTNPADTGSFRLLLDINPTYANNDPAGYPRDWRKYTVTISGLSAPTQKARFAFRYFGVNAGLNGPNYAGVVGIDSLAFVHQ